MARRLIGPEILTRTEAARVLGVHPATVARWATAGTLHSFRTPSGQRRYRICDVQALLNRRGLADGASFFEAVQMPIEALADEHHLLALPRQAALSLPASSGEYPGYCPARPARAAG
jgi:excisionase family DNA binding protein